MSRLSRAGGTGLFTTSTCVIRPPAPQSAQTEGPSLSFHPGAPGPPRSSASLTLFHRTSHLNTAWPNAQVKSPLQNISPLLDTTFSKEQQTGVPWGCDPWGSQGPGLTSPLGPTHWPESPPTSPLSPVPACVWQVLVQHLRRTRRTHPETQRGWSFQCLEA